MAFVGLCSFRSFTVGFLVACVVDAGAVCLTVEGLALFVDVV